MLHVPGQAELGDLVPPRAVFGGRGVVPSVLLWSVPRLFGSFASGASRVWRDFDGLWLERGCGVIGGFVLADWWEGKISSGGGRCGLLRVQVGLRVVMLRWVWLVACGGGCRIDLGGPLGLEWEGGSTPRSV